MTTICIWISKSKALRRTIRSLFYHSWLVPAFAEYILMSGSEAYQPFMLQMQEKIHMSKIVIEFLNKMPEATYEDLLIKLQVDDSVTSLL